MKFQWPELLALLLVLPLLAGLYLWLLRRRKRGAVRFASLAVVKEAMGRGQALRRHVPPALLMLALAALLVGVARPSAMVNLPGGNKMVVLAIDVSGSMRAGDVKPSRIAAAQAAARAFVAEQPAGTRVGLVSFAATASPVQVPTHDREAIVAAIERLQLQRGTALGSAILDVNQLSQFGSLERVAQINTVMNTFIGIVVAIVLVWGIYLVVRSLGRDKAVEA